MNLVCWNAFFSVKDWRLVLFSMAEYTTLNSLLLLHEQLSPLHTHTPPHTLFSSSELLPLYCIISFLQPCSTRLSPQLSFNSQRISFFCITVYGLQCSKHFSKENQTKNSSHKKHPLIALYTVLVSSSLLDAAESYPRTANAQEQSNQQDHRWEQV